MYFRRGRRLSGLGQGPMDYITGASALLKAAGPSAGGGGGGGGGAPGSSTTVATSTQVSTQVSPQISPVFVQQSSPKDSAVNANPSMAPATLAPVQSFAVPATDGTPVTGAIPGFDNASGYAPTGVPSRIVAAGTNWSMIAIAVAVAAGAAFMLKKKRA